MAKTRQYTSKQMGDACEMLVAAELTLAGIPALKVPDLWPGYDIIAQPEGLPPQRISVKSRTFKQSGTVIYKETDQFDWIAVVLLGRGSGREIYIVPRHFADRTAYRNAEGTKNHLNRFWRIVRVGAILAAYRDNFALIDHDASSAPLPAGSV